MGRRIDSRKVDRAQEVLVAGSLVVEVAASTPVLVAAGLLVGFGAHELLP